MGSPQFPTMLVHLVRAKSLAVILGPEWIGVMAVVDRLLGIVGQTAWRSLPFVAARAVVPATTCSISRSRFRSPSLLCRSYTLPS